LYQKIKRILRNLVPGTPARSRRDQEHLSIAFGCVVDVPDQFRYQAARLLLSLRWNGGRVAGAPFFLLSTAPLTGDAGDFFTRHGAITRQCRPFDEVNPGNAHIPSNKLRLFEIPELEFFDRVVLIDCDTIIVRDPTEHLRADGISAKLADIPTISDEQLHMVLEILGIERRPKPRYRYELAEAETIGYFNSGLLVIPRAWIKPLTNRWAEHTRKLLERTGKLPFPEFHVNQAALAATIVDLDPPLNELPAEMNLPVHFARDRYPPHYQEIDPIVIHYHKLAGPDGLIKQLPLSRAWERASEFNERLKAELALQANMNPAPESPTRPRQAGGPKIIVGSGWWSDEAPHAWAKGDELTTRVEFFSLWYRQVRKYLAPHRIVITDSHSPNKPDWQAYDGITWIELDRNYGHPNDVRTGKIRTKYSGFTRSVLNGAMFALCCDADYYVYLEQDCLIRGEDFLEHAIGDSDADILFGDRTEGGVGIEGKPAAPMYQQSCIIVRKQGLEHFISGLLAGPESDGELSPEVKMARDLESWDVLRVPYGRSRPIDFGRSHFYAQHLQQQELDRFLEAEGIPKAMLLDRSRRLFGI